MHGRASAIVTHNVRDFLPAAPDFKFERHAPEDEAMSKNPYPFKLPTSLKKTAAHCWFQSLEVSRDRPGWRR